MKYTQEFLEFLNVNLKFAFLFNDLSETVIS